jgi:hypothetical protein
MEALLCCEVCGNERQDPAAGRCPFCGAAVEPRLGGRGPRHKVVNLERGLPLVEEALVRLERELDLARMERCRVLTLIHGYGSSGRGGAIRHEVRAQLEYLKSRGRINDLLAGEEFSSRTGPGRQLLRRFPFLRDHADLNRANPGITLVVL